MARSTNESSGQEIESKLLWQFRVDDNVKAVYDKLAADSRMKALVDRYCGLRIMRVDPWECLVFFILSAHNHYQARVPTAPTANSMDKIAERFWEGESCPHDRYPFPSPQEVASPSGLGKLQELWSEQTDKPEAYTRSKRDAMAHKRGSALCRGWAAASAPR